jgi:hypothetical protein
MPLYDNEVCDAVAAEMGERGRVTVAWEIDHRRLLQYMDRLLEIAKQASEPHRSIHEGEFQLLATLLSARVAAENSRATTWLVAVTGLLAAATAVLVVVSL